MSIPIAMPRTFALHELVKKLARDPAKGVGRWPWWSRMMMEDQQRSPTLLFAAYQGWYF
jgi:hypothetical protein